MSEDSQGGVTESVQKILRERFSSVLYGTFVISWWIWNWEALYVTFFLEQELIFQKFQQLKIEYVISLYSGSYFYGFYVTTLIRDLLFLLVGPLVSSFFVVWILSKLDRCFQEKAYSNRLKFDRIENNYKIEKLKLKERESKQEIGTVGAEIEKVDLQKVFYEAMSNEDKWNIEYEKLKGDIRLQESLSEMFDCLYARGGRSSVYDSIRNVYIYKMSSVIKGFLDLNGLAVFSGDTIAATEKGKYFLGKLTGDKKLQ